MDAAQAPAPQPRSLGAGRLRTVAVLAVTAALVTVAVWIADRPADDGVTVRPGQVASGEPPRSGAVPPDFSATAIDGTAVSMAALKGQPTWLTFGASWCPDCRAEATDLQAAYEEYGPQGLAILGVFIDEPEAAAKEYAERVGFTFPLVSDPQGKIADLYRTYGIPIHFFVARDGTIQDVRIGRLTPEDMDQAIGQILGS